jgi:hypothetical protein
MFVSNKMKIVCCGLALMLISATQAMAQVSASGTVTAAPDGANFLYTINLTNTGSAGSDNIETFWFSWLPDHYDFLPSVPTNIVAPAGWTDYVESGIYGHSIEFYDTANNPIKPGQTNSSFQFVSPDTPNTVSHAGSVGLEVTYSYVYSGTPVSGPGTDPSSDSAVIVSMAVSTVPEPASFVLAGIGGMAGLMFWRRRRAAAA